jgi:hypothetical protein
MIGKAEGIPPRCPGGSDKTEKKTEGGEKEHPRPGGSPRKNRQTQKSQEEIEGLGCGTPEGTQKNTRKKHKKDLQRERHHRKGYAYPGPYCGEHRKEGCQNHTSPSFVGENHGHQIPSVNLTKNLVDKRIA